MKLSELDIELGYSVMQRIQEEFDEFKAAMYAGKTLEERKELDQFFTPPSFTIPLLESLLDTYEDHSFKGKDILDPTSGTGNLLMACIIAGAEPTRVYGNDYDKTMVKACLARLNKYCNAHNLPEVPKEHIHQGNALQKRCLTDFSDWYIRNYNIKYIDDPKYAQSYKYKEKTTIGITIKNKQLPWWKENELAEQRWKANEEIKAKAEEEKKKQEQLKAKQPTIETVSLF